MTTVAGTPSVKWDEPVHETFLPFPRRLLVNQFARVRSDGSDVEERERYLRYYEKSLEAHAEGVRRRTDAERTGVRDVPTKLDVQIEKDERFWVVRALLGLLDRSEPVDASSAFAELLGRAFPGGGCPVAGETWESLLAGQLELRFEANLPAPAGYQAHRRTQLDSAFLLPHQRTAKGLETRRLEGATKADAVLVNKETGFSAIFEAKVLSDVSTTVTFDARRNQLARLLDVSLEPLPADEKVKTPDPALSARVPERTCVVLLTPETFREDPTSRLYGWLHGAYRSNPASLKKHLPHRSLDECWQAGQRLGWVTWEDVAAVRPDVVPWVDCSSQTDHHSPSARITAEDPNTSA